MFLWCWGVSNISFGLSKDARKILNMVFLYNALSYGLDIAIINPAEYLGIEAIPGEEIKLAEDLIFNTRKDALERFVDYFNKKTPQVQEVVDKENSTKESIEDQLKNCLMERNKTKIISLIDQAMEEYSAEHIINNILMEAMRNVGDKLDTGEMVLPYVLQSAEVMRKAIEYLKDFLPLETSNKKGKILLATVFGDVHDIGKNLVKMILENNGFSIVDLGKQVPVEKIIEEAKKNKVDAIGLSALLVSTARHMKTCIELMCKEGLSYPVLIGGAPTNKRFAKEISSQEDETVYPGGVFYAKDAFTGLNIAQALSDPAKRKNILNEYHKQFEETGIINTEILEDKKNNISNEKAAPSRLKEAPNPPFYGVRSFDNIPIDEVFDYLDERMLFEISWGSKFKDKIEKKTFIENEYKPLLKELKEEAIRNGWFDLKAVYGYFKCRIENEDMEVLDEKEKTVETIRFLRTDNPKNRSLVDYFLKGKDNSDLVIFQAVTVGDKINDAIKKLNDDKEYTRAFLVHGLSVNLAEALAAYMHDRVRKELGMGDKQGKRYSPGYPLWQDLEDQKKIFKLLEVKKNIGIDLTEGYQMVPEQSTTAMIVHNDEAEY